MSSTDPHVEVRGLSKDFPIRSGILNRVIDHVHALEHVDLAIPPGKTYGLIGESGSGKTTIARCVLRLLVPTTGDVYFNGENIFEYSGNELKELRRNAQIVWQDPTSSLNPKKPVGKIITKPMKIHDIGTKAERRERAIELLETVGLSEEHFTMYPGTLSGGQKQRVGIARALSVNPEFVVLDEPTSALDVSVQARIIKLLKNLQDEYDLTYLFISHDISLISNVADMIGVMYLGEIVEEGPATDIIHDPQHPYTRGLMSTVPTLTDADEAAKPTTFDITGEIPDPRNKPTGCSFRTRCPVAFEQCAKANPELYQVNEDRVARCFLHDEEYASDGPTW